MIERTYDYALVRRILTHPQVYEGIHDDFGVGAGNYTPPACEDVIYLTDGDGLLFIAHPLSGAMWQGHQAALPGYGGKRVIQGLKAGLEWMREFGAYKVIGLTPAYMKHAIRVAIAAGMQREGVISSAFLRDGSLHDLVITGATLWESKQSC